MSVRWKTWALIAGTWLSPAGADAAPPPDAGILIRRLGAPAFQVRESASLALRTLGLEALEPLREAAESDDLEVRYRARELLKEVEHAAQDEALGALLSGEPLVNESRLPGWQRFREIVQDDRLARPLFAEMVRADPHLFRVFAGGRDALQAEFERRCGDLTLFVIRNQNAAVPPEQALALLFVGGHPDCHPSPAAAVCVNNLAMQPSFRSAVLASESPAPLKRLLGAWISREDHSSTMQRLALAAQFELPEGVDVALEIVHGRGRGIQLQYAIFYIAKAGGADQLHELEALLGNTEQLTVQRRQDNETFSSLVKDAALAGLVHMTGQSTDEYGYVGLKSDPLYLFAPNTAGFQSEDDRAAAFARWDDWQREHLKQNFPVDPNAVEGTSL